KLLRHLVIFPTCFALALGAQHQSALPRRGTIKWDHDMTSFMVVDDETGFCPTFPCEREQGRFARSFEGRFWSEAEVRETCLRAN
ncbi:hypothetical protein, partial [Streptococcus salivarius]|uniref:hypothetical protein n=1 Tax=Streptococcus salivarius TaxID=1304 RepID=UPI001D06538C